MPTLKDVLAYVGATVVSMLIALLVLVQPWLWLGLFTTLGLVVWRRHQRRVVVVSEVEIRRLAAHEMGHALVASLADEVEVMTVTVDLRLMRGNVTFRHPALRNADEVFTALTIALAGIEAEALLFGCSTGGVKDTTAARELSTVLAGRGSIISHGGGNYCDDPASVLDLARNHARSLLDPELLEVLIDDLLSTPTRRGCHTLGGARVAARVRAPRRASSGPLLVPYRCSPAHGRGSELER